jgi:hypothetical protein
VILICDMQSLSVHHEFLPVMDIYCHEHRHASGVAMVIQHARCPGLCDEVIVALRQLYNISPR